MVRTAFIALVAAAVLLVPVGVVHGAGFAQGDTGSGDNLPFLFAAFAVTWVGFVAYITYLVFKNRDLQRQIEDLRILLDDRTSTVERSAKHSG